MLLSSEEPRNYGVMAMKQVKIGVGFGLWRLGMPPAETIARVAERAEDWGLDSFWLSDHLLAPSPELDVVATLSLLASRTSRMKLGPSVLLLNLRHPLMVAKSFASLDYLSGGRMVMAVDTVTIDPRPAARTNNDFGTMDIWVGGRSDAALKRAARLADGFFASFQTPDEFGASMAKIHDYAAGYGRANAHIESGLILLCRISSSRERALEEMRPMLTAMGRGAEAYLERTVYGSPDDLIARLSEYVAKGLDKFVLWPIAEPDAWPKQIELVGREIAAHYATA